MLNLFKSAIACRFGLVTQAEHERLLKDSAEDMKRVMRMRLGGVHKERIVLLRDLERLAGKLEVAHHERDVAMRNLKFLTEQTQNLELKAKEGDH